MSDVWVNCGAVRQILVGSHPIFPVHSTPKVSLPPAIGRPRSRVAAVHRKLQLDSTYTATTCHPAPGRRPDRRTVDVYVLSSLHKTRSTTAQTPVPQFPRSPEGADRGWIHRVQFRAELVAADRNWWLETRNNLFELPRSAIPPSVHQSPPTSDGRAGYPAVRAISRGVRVVQPRTCRGGGLRGRRPGRRWWRSGIGRRVRGRS